MAKQSLFKRFFPHLFIKKIATPYSCPEETKKELALEHLSKGEMALLQDNLSAISFFETATALDPNNPVIWFRQGLSFVEYGMKEGREKALSLAGKHFKMAVSLDANYFEAWAAWGNALLELGKFHEENHFFIEAKEKYQKAISLIDGASKEVLADFYWEYALVWISIGSFSGEAIDIRFALEAFQTSLQNQGRPSAEFMTDFGNGYLQLGLLLNDSQFYFQAIDRFRHAVSLQPQYFEGWDSMAQAYYQLYLNTANEKFCTQASDAFAKASEIFPNDVDLLLDWAALLTESGRLNKNPKQLLLAKEKGAHAYRLEPKNPLVISQWVESTALLGAMISRLDLLIEAEERIARASETFSDDPEIWYAYGIAQISLARYYEDADYCELAIDKFQFGLSLDRSDAELWQELALAHRYYANLVSNIDLLERATRFFTRAMDLKPACAPLLFESASAFLALSEYEGYFPLLDQAISFYESALEQYKESILYHPEWLYQYASALEWHAESEGEESHYVRSLELFAGVLLIDPDFPDVHFRMGVVCVQLGHLSEESAWYSRALSYFRLAQKQDKENELLLFEWGNALIHLGELAIDKDQAREYYADAEQKILAAGQLGHSGAYYQLAGLYSLTHRTELAMEFIYKAYEQRLLPSIDAMLEDEWLENLHTNEAFVQFLFAVEAKQHQLRED